MTTRSLAPGRRWDGFDIMPGLLPGGDTGQLVDKAMSQVAEELRQVLPPGTKPIVRPLMPDDYGDKDGWYHPPEVLTRWGTVLNLILPNYTYVVLMHMESDLSRPSQPASLRILRDEEVISLIPLWGVFAGVGVSRDGGSRLAGFPIAPIIAGPGEEFQVQVSLTDPRVSARIFFGGVVIQPKLELLRPEQEWADPAKQAPVMRTVGGRKGAPGAERKNPLVQTVDEGDVAVMVVGDEPPSPTTEEPGDVGVR